MGLWNLLKAIDRFLSGKSKFPVSQWQFNLLWGLIFPFLPRRVQIILNVIAIIIGVFACCVLVALTFS